MAPIDSKSRKSQKQSFFHSKLQIEHLEDRCTPATFVVNTLNDTPVADLDTHNAFDSSGQVSLRSAIQQANYETGFDTITFSSTLSGTISLLIALDSISTAMSIEGPGDGSIIVERSTSASTNYSVMRVNSSASAIISGMYLTKGTGSAGGGIYNEGTLYVTDCKIYGNYGSNGGGIYNHTDGELYISDSGIYLNDAASGGGLYNLGEANILDATHIFSNDAYNHGGGIYNTGTLDCSGNTLIYSNSAGYLGGGVYTEDTATFANVSISSNSADKGGGIYVYSGNTTLSYCTIQYNTATTLGPGICRRIGASVSENDSIFSQGQAVDDPNNNPGGD